MTLTKKIPFLFSLLLYMFVATEHVIAASNIQYQYSTDKLTSTLFTDITQDAYGYTWIATEYGLNRFDGVVFTHFLGDEDSDTGLHGNNVKRVYSDKKGNLWVLTQEGLHLYDHVRNRFKWFPATFKGAICHDFFDLCLKDSNHILSLTTSGHIFEFDITHSHGTIKPNLKLQIGAPLPRILFFSTADHILFVGTLGHGIYMYDLHSNQQSQCAKKPFLLPAATITAMQSDSRGGLLISTTQGLYRWAKKQLMRISSTPTNKCIETGSCLMAATYNDGIQRLRYNGYNSWKAEDSPLLQHFHVSAIYMDTFHRLWAGLSSQSLFMSPQRAYSAEYISSSSLPQGTEAVISSVTPAKDGSVWIGQCNGGGLAHLQRDGTLGETILAGTTVYAALEDTKGNLWIGPSYKKISKGGLYIRRPGKKAIQSVDMGDLCSSKIKQIVEDKDGSILVAYLGRGIVRVSQSGKLQPDAALSNIKLREGTINTIATDSKHRLWVGTYAGASCMNMKSGAMIPFANDSLFFKSTVYHILLYGSSVYFATSKGLYCYDESKKKLHRYSTRDGLPNNNVCSVIADNSGCLWLSTYNGISCFNPRTKTFANHTYDNGLKTAHYAREIGGITADGRLFFADDHGVTLFHAGKMVAEKFSQPVRLTAVMSGDSILPLKEDINLSSGDNTFVLRFSTMDYRDPQNVVYEYRFQDDPEGVWHQTLPGVNSITFSHLPHGQHNLIIRASDGGVSSESCLISIHIQPPFYLTWWAYLIYFSIMALIAYGGYLQYRLILLQRKRVEESVLPEPKIANEQKYSEKEQQFVDKLQEIVRVHLNDNDLCVESVANEMGVSRAQLQRRVKELMGDSVGNIIRNIRMHHAAQMLLNPDNNVADIAYAIGFSAPSLLSSSFKRYYGMTPTEYRERHR